MFILKFSFLTPKVLLSPVGIIWASSRLVQFQFMLRFFEIFMEDVVFYKLRMHIIFSKIGQWQKVMTIFRFRSEKRAAFAL